MNFLDNVVKTSNALLKDKLQNPFGSKDSSTSNDVVGSVVGSENPTPTDSSASNAESQQSTKRNSEIGSGNVGDHQPRSSISGEAGIQFAAIAADAEAVTKKAVDGAKNIGTFLFSMANKAGKHVSETAKQVKKVVENTNIMTDLTREQQEFIKDHGGNVQAGDLPWNCYADDETKTNEMKEQILSLSQDKRNFVRGPPNDSNFVFNAQDSFPIALSLLKEDPNLGKLRYELVPKLVNEDTFWRNYFYRVSLLKQFIDQGDTSKLQQQKQNDWHSSRSSSGEGPDEITINEDSVAQNIGGPPSISSSLCNDTDIKSTENINYQFRSTNEANDKLAEGDSQSAPTSGAFDNQVSGITRQGTYELQEDSRKLLAQADDLTSTLRELGIDDVNDWELELQKDLQEYELISKEDLNSDEQDVECLDKDIMDYKLRSIVKDGS